MAVEHAGRIAIVEMHINNTQPLYCQEADLRKFYYLPPAAGVYPNGWLWYDGDQHGKTDFWTWDSLVSERINKPSPVFITMWGYFSPSSGNGMVYARFRNDSLATINGRAVFVVTEDSLHYQAINFDTIHNHVARDYLPDQNGTVITIAPGDSMTVNHPFAINAGWIMDNCNLIAWLQNDSVQVDSTREIWQGAMIPLASLGVDEQNSGAPGAGAASVIPNPCATHAEISFPTSLTALDRVLIYDALGRQVATIKPEFIKNGRAVTWDCRDHDGARVSPGIYFYRTHSGKEPVNGKIIVR